MAKKEFTFTILLIVTGVASFIYSLGLPDRGNIALSPGLFPSIVSLLLILLNSYYLIISILRSKKSQTKLIIEKGMETDERSLIVICSLFIGYLILLHYLHFIAATILFLFTAMFFLYKKFYWKIPIISVSAVFLIFYLFRYLLNVRLP